MTTRRGNEDQVLAGAVETLRYIVNLEFPEARGLPVVGPELEKFLSRVRLHTQVYWPELWAEEPGQRPPESMLRRMRNLLRQFWEASDDPRARDWYIHRAREFYQEPRALRATNLLREMVRKAATKNDALDLITHHVAPKETDTLDQLPHIPLSRMHFLNCSGGPNSLPRVLVAVPTVFLKKDPIFSAM